MPIDPNADVLTHRPKLKELKKEVISKRYSVEALEALRIARAAADRGEAPVTKAEFIESMNILLRDIQDDIEKVDVHNARYTVDVPESQPDVRDAVARLCSQNTIVYDENGNVDEAQSNIRNDSRIPYALYIKSLNIIKGYTSPQDAARFTKEAKERAVSQGKADTYGRVIPRGGEAVAVTTQNMMPFYIEGSMTDEEDIVAEYHFPSQITIKRITLSCRTAPTGADLSICLMKDGVEQSAVAVIRDGETYGTAEVSATYLPTNRFGIRTKNVGSTEPGEGLTITLHY